MHLASFVLVLPFLAGFFGDAGQVNTSTINCIKGNGRQTTEARQIAQFDALEVEGSFTVTVVCGQSATLSIKAESNLLPYISSQLHGSTLKIFARKSICATDPIILTLTTQQLQRLQAEGANDISVENLVNDSFTLGLEGAGDARLAGATSMFTAIISGSGDVQALALQAKEVNVSIAGAASARVTALEQIHVTSSGASDVCYGGNPAKVTTTIDGVGDVESCQ